VPEIIDGKNWAERVVENSGPNTKTSTKIRRSLLTDQNAKVMNSSSAIRAAASPYEVIIHEDMATYDLKIVLVDNRQADPQKIMVTIPRSITGRDGGNIDPTIMKAVKAAKNRLQEKLAKDCDEPEIRLWAAKNRDVDLMDNSEIPSRIRVAYSKSTAVANERERLSNQERNRATPQVIEQSIESDNGPVYDTPPPRARKVVRRRPPPTIRGMKVSEEAQSKTVSGEPTQEEVKENVPVATVKGAYSKSPKRKPRCNSRDHDDAPEMDFHPEDGVWKCPVQDCKTIARPKSDSPVGKVQLGKGRLDLRVLFVEPGEKPSILLVADNNIALDVTDYVDLENFLKYNRVQAKAQNAANAGEEITVATNTGGKETTALLRFPEMRIYGCDNA
jgi:hypothetical protein